MRIILVFLAGVSVALGSAGWVADRNSDDFKLGWAEGRAAALSEARGMDQFRECIEVGRATPRSCWVEQVNSAQTFYEAWDAMTDKQKIAYGEQKFNHRWIDNLRSKNPYDFQAYLAQVTK